jgi:uncharacterized protein YndB with AHSA1/START domain
MRFRAELTYDAPPDAVHAMLADPEFRHQVCADQQVVSAEVSIIPRDPGMSVEIDQIQPTQGVPSFAKSVIGATSRAIQVEEWADDRSATLDIRTPGKPATMRGTITLLPRGSGTTEVVELDVRTSVPLIGGRLERLFADLVQRSITSEEQTGRAWLAR